MTEVFSLDFGLDALPRELRNCFVLDYFAGFGQTFHMLKVSCLGFLIQPVKTVYQVALWPVSVVCNAAGGGIHVIFTANQSVLHLYEEHYF